MLTYSPAPVALLLFGVSLVTTGYPEELRPLTIRGIQEWLPAISTLDDESSILLNGQRGRFNVRLLGLEECISVSCHSIYDENENAPIFPKLSGMRLDYIHVARAESPIRTSHFHVTIPPEVGLELEQLANDLVFRVCFDALANTHFREGEDAFVVVDIGLGEGCASKLEEGASLCEFLDVLYLILSDGKKLEIIPDGAVESILRKLASIRSKTAPTDGEYVIKSGFFKPVASISSNRASLQNGANSYDLSRFFKLHTLPGD